MSNITRRRFLEDSILATAAAAMPISLIEAQEKKAAAIDKINVALIGCGIRGKQHATDLARFAECDVSYVCDPDTDRMAEVSKILVDKKRPAPKAVADMRKIFED